MRRGRGIPVRQLFGVLRVLAAAAIIVAIVGQFAQSWSMVPDRLAFLVNFFSYFTILSNAVAAIVLLVGAWYSFTRQGRSVLVQPRARLRGDLHGHDARGLQPAAA